MLLQGQNMANNEHAGDESNNEQEEEQQQAPVKEDFIKAPKSQSSDSLNADPFDQNSDITENQIHNMTREAGDGQNDTSTENAEWLCKVCTRKFKKKLTYLSKMQYEVVLLIYFIRQNR